jgi:transposase
MVAVPCCVGIDVAKAPLESALRPAGARWAVPNDARGVATLVERWQARHPTLRGLEATGGLERAAPAEVATAGRPVGVVNPRPAREFACATGPLAKPDALAARALAHFAAVIRPAPRPRPEAQTRELRALRGRRQPLIVMRPAAQHRLAGTSASRAQDREAPIPWRTARLAPLADDRETLLRASPVWRASDDLWQRAPGLGPVGARTLRLELPALGTRTRQQIAACVGVAPLHGDSGPLRGRRPSWGGRAHVRPVVYMGPLVATRSTPRIKAFSERLLAAGKGKKVALTACMPKLLTILNAMWKQRTPWQSQEVQG